MRAGLTLVELLVAMTLLAFLSTALLGGLRFGARAWEASGAASAERDEVALAHGFLRARLSSASRPAGATHAGELVGARDRMAFVAPWLAQLGRGGLYRFDLSREDGSLVVAWRPVDGDGAPAGRRVLLEGVTALRLSYFGAHEPDAPPAWRDAWRAPGRGPRLVRVEIGFARGGRVWPDLVVARP